MASRKQLYTLRLELLGISPLIWRRVRVPIDIDLASLHYVFQVVMGWTDSHLHSFKIGGQEYQMDVDEDNDLSFEASIALSSVLNDVREFIYVYDFGDHWRHRVIVESKAKMDEPWDFPVCLGGERACPPEDVGGVGSYEDFLETISDPDSDEYESTLLWVGGVFDPNSFDVNRVNRELRGFCLHVENMEEGT